MKTVLEYVIEIAAIGLAVWRMCLSIKRDEAALAQETVVEAGPARSFYFDFFCPTFGFLVGVAMCLIVPISIFQFLPSH